jgi:transcriptional regulator GlxA family with amidase domain
MRVERAMRPRWPVRMPLRTIPDRRVQRILDLVQGGVNRAVTVSELAARVALSRSRLEHLFKEETGVALKPYLEGARFRRAKALLRGSGLSVKQVAFACGYADPANLTKDFKRRSGMTPSRYRRRTAIQEAAHFAKK